MWLIKRKQSLVVGDILAEKNWDDTTIKIVELSNNKREARYIFLTINGRKILSSTKSDQQLEYTLECRTIRSVCKHINK